MITDIIKCVYCGAVTDGQGCDCQTQKFETLPKEIQKTILDQFPDFIEENEYTVTNIPVSLKTIAGMILLPHDTREDEPYFRLVNAEIVETIIGIEGAACSFIKKKNKNNPSYIVFFHPEYGEVKWAEF